MYTGKTITIGPLAISLTGQVEVKGKVVPLKENQRKIMLYLALHSETIVWKDQLLKWAWEEPPDSGRKLIEVHVHYIRKALERVSPGSSGHIVTVWGHGYWLSQNPDTIVTIDRHRCPDSLNQLLRKFVTTMQEAAANVAHA